MPPEALPLPPQFPWSALGTVALTLAFILIAFLSGGCTSINKQLDALPAANADEVHYVRTGKFSSTTIVARGFANDGKQTTVNELTVRHSNLWIPNLEIIAKGYRRTHTTPLAPPAPPAAPSSVLEVK